MRLAEKAKRYLSEVIEPLNSLFSLRFCELEVEGNKIRFKVYSLNSLFSLRFCEAPPAGGGAAPRVGGLSILFFH